MKELTASSKALSCMMAGVLAVAFAPTLVAPAQAQAATAFVTDKDSAIEFIEDQTNYKKYTEAQCKEIAGYATTYDLAEDDFDDEAGWKAVLEAKVGATEIPKESTKVNTVTTSITKLTSGDGSVTVKFSVNNPREVSGLQYRVGYKQDGAKKWTFVTTKKKTVTFTGLKAKATKVKVRAQKKYFAEKLVGPYSAKKTETPFVKGKYKVTAGVLNVRKKATTSSKAISKVYRGKKLTVSALVKKNGRSWGKVKVNGKTGYVYMAYMKKA